MINVGIYLATEQNGGGTYQYNLSVICALKALDKKEYKLTAFFHSGNWSKHLSDDFTLVGRRRSVLHKISGRLFTMVNKNPEVNRKFAPFFNPIIKKINNSNCDIVIFPSQDAVSYQTKKRSLSTIHDLMHRYESHFEEYQNGEHDRREKHYAMMCKYAKGILVDSNVGKQHVVESYNIDEKNVFVLPFVPPFYLLDAKDIDVKSKYNLPDKYFFYPAQFWEHKNHLNLLNAVKILKDKDIEINLVLVGSKKNNYSKVTNKINELELDNNVYILGYVSNDDMASLYKNAIATIFVSLIGPTNIPPLEAMILGSPLICSNAYAMPEQVGDAALLIDPMNANDIAEKMQKIIDDEVLAKTCVQNGKKIIELYGQKEFSMKLELYIKSCL